MTQEQREFPTESIQQPPVSPDSPVPPLFVNAGRQRNAIKEDREVTAGDDRADSRYLLIWGALSIAILGVLGFGSIPAWRYHWDPIAFVLSVDRSRETFMHIWTYQVEHLPSIGSELAIQVVFLVAVLVFIVGTLAGLWLLIVPDRHKASHNGI
jgi:hypothetical protein